MSSNLQSRLDALEARFQPVDTSALDAETLWWVHALSETALSKAVDTFAATFAATRFHAEGGFPPGARTGHVDDWREVLTEDQRRDRVAAETDRLEVEDLDAWIVTAQREGWPVLRGPTYTLDFAGFEEIRKRYAHSLQFARGVDDPRAEVWRRLHPQWRLDLSDEELDHFEMNLLISQARDDD
jgi:hypothetical protein